MTAGPKQSLQQGEMDRLLAEAVAMERAGTMDEAALRKFDAAMQRQFDRDNAEFANRLAEIQRQPVELDARPGRLTSAPARVAVAVVLVVVLTGLAFQLIWGDAFVPAVGATYRTAATWAFALLILPLLAFFVRSRDPNLRSRFPTAWLRVLVMYPLLAAVSAGAIVVSPFGWVAFATRFMGDRVEREATVATVGELRRPGHRGCRQSGSLRLHSEVTTVCLSERVAGPAVAAGDAVTVAGRETSLGIVIETIRRR